MKIISFDRAAEYYDATRGYPAGVAELMRDAIVESTGTGNTARFLELGVGTGLIALPFMQAGYNYTGIDISANMMSKLLAKATEAELPQPKVAQANIYQLPFADGTFDVGIAVHVFHLIDDMRAALLEARRVLSATNATLLITRQTWQSQQNTPCDFVPDNVSRYWREVIREMGISPQAEPPGVLDTDERLEKLLAEMHAQTQPVKLMEFDLPELSPRDMLERHRAKMYSSDWSLTDEQHTEALRRTEEWLATSGLNLDEYTTARRSMNAVVARW